MSDINMNRVSDGLLRSALALLEPAGFKRENGVGITFRRESEIRIDVFEFEIYSPSKCAKWNIPPFSFSVNVGCLYKFIPSFADDNIEDNPKAHPQEFECHFRMNVLKGIWQWRCRDKNVWCVKPDGKVPDRIYRDIHRLIIEDVLPWFSRFDDLENVARDLINSKAENNKYRRFLKSYRLSFGVPLQIPAFFALRTKNMEGALELAKEALASPLFTENYPKITRVKTALEELIMSIQEQRNKC